MSGRKLTIEDLAAMDVAGRAFASREGGARFRGTVRGARVENNFLTIEVADVERCSHDEDWRAIDAFNYGGARSNTHIYADPDGAIQVTIDYIGSVRIAPPRKSCKGTA